MDAEVPHEPSAPQPISLTRVLRGLMRLCFPDREIVSHSTVVNLWKENFLSTAGFQPSESALWVAGVADEALFEDLCRLLDRCGLSVAKARKLNVALMNEKEETVRKLREFLERTDNLEAQNLQSELDSFIASLKKKPLATFAREHNLEFTNVETFLDRVAAENPAALEEIIESAHFPEGHPLPPWRADPVFCAEKSIVYHLKTRPPTLAIPRGNATFRDVAKRLIYRYVYCHRIVALPDNNTNPKRSARVNNRPRRPYLEEPWFEAAADQSAEAAQENAEDSDGSETDIIILPDPSEASNPNSGDNQPAEDQMAESIFLFGSALLHSYGPSLPLFKRLFLLVSSAENAAIEEEAAEYGFRLWKRFNAQIVIGSPNCHFWAFVRGGDEPIAAPETPETGTVQIPDIWLFLSREKGKKTVFCYSQESELEIAKVLMSGDDELDHYRTVNTANPNVFPMFSSRSH